MEFSSTHLLVLSDLNVERFNFMAAPMVNGYSINTFHGFLHALERTINQNGFHLRFGRFLPVIHENHAEAPSRLTKLIKQSKSEKQDKIDSPHSLTAKRNNGTLRVSFIVEIETPVSSNPFASQAISLPDEKLVGQYVNRMKLAGGFIKHCTQNTHIIDVNKTDNLAIKVNSLVPAGSLLVSRHDLFNQYSEQMGAAKGMVHALSLHPVFTFDEESNKIYLNRDNKPAEKSDTLKFSRAQPGWIIPMVTGFMSTETPTEGRVPDYAHVYAEPIITLGEFISFKRSLATTIRDRKPLLTNIPFWTQEIDPDKGIYTFKHTLIN